MTDQEREEAAWKEGRCCMCRQLGRPDDGLCVVTRNAHATECACNTPTHLRGVLCSCHP